MGTTVITLAPQKQSPSSSTNTSKGGSRNSSPRKSVSSKGRRQSTTRTSQSGSRNSSTSKGTRSSSASNSTSTSGSGSSKASFDSALVYRGGEIDDLKKDLKNRNSRKNPTSKPKGILKK